ncbi:MAG TPA: TauD/TfdA family dioxygenase [Pyrinomonadaceae bacterium]|nr:TauD/TfdA family dioxygenase [Pyrinomonadaceae bacterium]
MDQPPSMRPGTSRRKAIALSSETLIKESLLRADVSLPLVLEPAVDALSLTEWTSNNRDLIVQKLRTHGAILFRGFNPNSVEEFEQFLRLLIGDLLPYSYRSTPRSEVSGRIYTSTEYPAHQSIPLHNEMSYTRDWPGLLGFFCVEPAPEGGETPIADSRRVFNSIAPAIRETFVSKGVMYVRNYGEALDLSWQNVFQTTDRAEVEAYCRKSDIQFEWKDQDILRTSQVCQAVANHPHTGEPVWFNQAHLFHVSSLESDVRDSLLSLAAGEPPRNAYYGDGTPIEESVLEQIREIYTKEAVAFSWQKHDILLLDNMLAAHGRRPFRGARKIVVGMG